MSESKNWITCVRVRLDTSDEIEVCAFFRMSKKQAENTALIQAASKYPGQYYSVSSGEMIIPDSELIRMMQERRLSKWETNT
jgi:hypothetical protein